MLSTMVGRGLSLNPKDMVTFFAMMSWMLFVIVMAYGYMGTLIMALSTRIQTPVPKTWKDLVDMDYEVVQPFLELLLTSNSPHIVHFRVSNLLI